MEFVLYNFFLKRFFDQDETVASMNLASAVRNGGKLKTRETEPKLWSALEVKCKPASNYRFKSPPISLMILSTLNNISGNDNKKKKIDELAFLVLETDQNLGIRIF